LGRGRNDDATAFRRKLRFFDTGFVSSILGVGTRSFPVASALIPPLNEVAAFAVGFVLSFDTDVIGMDSAAAIEQDGTSIQR
jgi:hypothetical protein